MSPPRRFGIWRSLIAAALAEHGIDPKDEEAWYAFIAHVAREYVRAFGSLEGLSAASKADAREIIARAIRGGAVSTGVVPRRGV
jgi:hypothetical protein